MEKAELIITTTKDVFLKTFTSTISDTSIENDLKMIDKTFKAITRTVIESYSESLKSR